MAPSPIRCRGPWKTRQRSSEPDRWLDEMGFFRKHVARDSSCLFRAVSENIYNTQKYFHKVRLDCVQFMASKRHLIEGSLNCPFENYLKELANPSECGGLIEISAMSHLYRHDFVIFEANKGPQMKICNGYGDTIFLFYSPETKHFDAVYTKEYINSSSFCQSVVYEILYDGVYQLKDLPYAVDKMLHDKIPSYNHNEYFMADNVERRKKQKEHAKIFIEPPNGEDKEESTTLSLKCKHHTQDIERASLLKESLSIFVFQRSLIQLENVCMNCLNVNSAKDLLDNGITPFPYKVAKALDPDIYRNIEFDVWSEMRREIRYGARYSDGTTLQVGVKCLVKLHPDQTVPYHCHIQEMRPDGGPCLVFIEELGEKRVVEFVQLEALPLDEVRPWAPPYRHSRANSQFLTLSQMLQQIGSVTRKQGLNKRKAKSFEDIKVQEKTSSPPKLIWKDGKDAEMASTPVGGQHDVEGITLLDHGGHVNQMDEITHLPTHENSILTKWQTQQHLDLFNFELTTPAEVSCVPLMVDCRGTSAPLDMHAHAPPPNNDHAGASGDMTCVSRATTPASGLPPPPPVHAYVSPMHNGGMSGAVTMPGMGPYMAPYAACSKPLLWMPHTPPPPPPPPPVSPNVYKSVHPNGSDLPLNDIPTLRYYFNMGVDCMMSTYGPPPPPPPPPPPAKHYSPRDLTQDMQQMSLHNREHNNDHYKYKDNKQPNNNKPPSQRPLLGPRFKRGTNNADNNQGNNSNNQQHKHNNMNNNKGANNRYCGDRRASHADNRIYDECPAEPMPTLQYMYPPPLYPVYYPIEDPAVIGVVGGMGYVGYDEGVDYNMGVPLQPYYPPYAPPHLARPMPPPPPATVAQIPPPPAHTERQEHK